MYVSVRKYFLAFSSVVTPQWSHCFSLSVLAVSCSNIVRLSSHELDSCSDFPLYLYETSDATGILTVYFRVRTSTFCAFSPAYSISWIEL